MTSPASPQGWTIKQWNPRKKHRKATKATWDSGEAKEWSGQRGAASQYNPHLYEADAAIESAEMECIEHGILIEETDERRTYYRNLAHIVGVCSGENTTFIFAEWAIGGARGAWASDLEKSIETNGHETMRTTPNLPQPWRTIGHLYDSAGNRSLGEDMFEAELPDGTLIAAGWSSENDPNGQYQVTVSRGLSHIRPVFTTPSMAEAAQHVESIAVELAAPSVVTAAPRLLS